MTIHRFRLPLLLLVILLLFTCLPACGNTESISTTPTLTLEEGTLTYATRLDAATLQSHEGQKAYLYELAPGETEEALAGRAPMLSCNVGEVIRFQFPLEENGITRRYHSYLLAFSDGTLLSHRPTSLSSKGDSAKAFPHSGTIKGLEAGRALAAASLHADHAVLELKLSDLRTGDGFAVGFNGVSYQLNAEQIALADAHLADAAKHAQQTTLLLEIDTAPNAPEFAALSDALLSRYIGGDFGTVSALCLILPEELSRQTDACAPYAAELLRIASVALTSRYANGRLYLGTRGTAQSITDFSLAVYAAVQSVSRVEFGVALLPQGVTSSMLSGSEADRFCLSNVVSISKKLSETMGRSTRFALPALEINTETGELAAALYTYAYRVAKLAQADLLCYRTAVNDQTGLYGTDFLPRPILNAFANADTSANSYGEELAAKLLGEEWTALSSVRPDRLLIAGAANEGTTEKLGDRLFDFSNGEPPQFTACGNSGVPTVIFSGLWQENVLTSSLERDVYGVGSGYSTSFSDSKQLTKAQVLSAKLLAQLPAQAVGTEATVTLLLNGTALDGRPLTCETKISVTCNTWTSVSFHIRDFTSLLNPNTPCSLTLLMEPADGHDYPCALFLHSANVRNISSGNSALIPLFIAVGGFAVGFGTMLLVARRRRRHS